MQTEWIINKNTLQEHIESGQCTFIEFHVKNTKRFELYATILGNSIRIATYSLNTKNVIITNPDWYIPTKEQLEHLVNFANEHQKKGENANE